MRLLFTADPEEYGRKRQAFIRALSAEFEPFDAELAHVLEKAAAPDHEPVLKYRALRDLKKRTSEAYQALVADMVADIEKILDSTIQKSEVTHDQVRTELQKFVGNSELSKQEDEDPDYDPESGEPIIDPKTGLSPSEQAEEEKENPPEDEDEDTEKALAVEGGNAVVVWELLHKAYEGPFSDRLGRQWADPEFSVPWEAAGQYLGKLQTWARARGGRLAHHNVDPAKVVLRLSKSRIAEAHALKRAYHVEDSILTGYDYVVLPIPIKAIVDAHEALRGRK